jgi:hypothetical protein
MWARAQTPIELPLTAAVTIRGAVYEDTNLDGRLLATRANLAASEARVLLDFDVAAIPPGSPIASATLTLTVAAAGAQPLRRIGAYDVSRPFRQGEATWTYARRGEPWATAGGDLGQLYAIGEASNQAGSTLTFDVTGLLQDAVNRRDIAREARIALVDVGDVPQSGGGRSYQPAFASTLEARPRMAVTVGARSSISTVFMIVLENRNWSQIKGSASAPFLNTLVWSSARAEQYYNPPHLHPSEPNYLWLEAGTNFGIRDNNDPPAINHQATHDHLVRRLADAGISWRSYMEDISGTDCPLVAIRRYSPIHNPVVYFDDVTDTNNPHSAYCIAHVRPFDELLTDLRNDTTARFNLVGPNTCHNGHDCGIATMDAWLSTIVPKITASAAYRAGGALFITWDEGSHWSDGPLGMIAVSPFAKAKYFNSIHYTHSSTLRTLQEIFGVTPFLGDAAHATDLRDLFSRWP